MTITPRKATKRMGPRERARLQAAVVAIVCLLLFFIVFKPWYETLRNTRDFQTCQTNVLKISRAISTYIKDWDDTLPADRTWMTTIVEYMSSTSGTGFDVRKYFVCPLDNSGSPSSYAYNDLFSGISLSIESPDKEKEARRKRLGRPARAPLVIEKHGSAENARITLENWDAVRREMTVPHLVPEPTGTLITGAEQPDRKTAEQLRNLAGKRF